MSPWFLKNSRNIPSGPGAFINFIFFIAVDNSAMEKACDHFVSRRSERDVRVIVLFYFFSSLEKALSEDEILKTCSRQSAVLLGSTYMVVSMYPGRI